jgi:hypothetical protein
MKTKHYLTLIAAALLAGNLPAEVIRLYDFSENPSQIGFNFIKGGTNEGVTWGAQIAALDETAKAAMGGVDGAFRIWSYESASYSRADATIELATPITGGFRVSFKAFNQNYFWVESSLRKVAVRGANPGVTWDMINSSSANYQNMLEVYTDGSAGGAWNRVGGVGEPRYITDPGGNAPDPVPLAAHTFDLIVNASATEPFTYVLHGKQRTLNPLKIDMFIDGILATPAANPNGSDFENKANFDPELGFGTISFTTATSSHQETDFVIDRAYIYTGDDVSEGEVIEDDEPIEAFLADSTPLGDGFYRSPLIGIVWSDGLSNWISTLDNWGLLVKADATGYWAYDVLYDEWVYLPVAAPGYIYNYNTGEWEW